jgi:glutamate racemase
MLPHTSYRSAFARFQTLSIFTLLLAWFAPAFAYGATGATKDPLETSTTRSHQPGATALREKETLKLVVTDSGLGGLSVAAVIARAAAETRLYHEVTITFVNALFRPEAGYNSLPTRGEKVRIFSSALRAMQDRYAPDAILVACNTLSVLLPDTAAAREGRNVIVGIVETGVDLVEEELRKNPAATAVLFGTQTTVDEDSHRRALLERGIAEERLVVQACPDLTWYIEQDPEGFETELMISNFVTEALEKRVGTTGPLAISFNCTHFGYSARIWQEEMAKQGAEVAATLNPNDHMGRFLFPTGAEPQFESTTVTVRVVSMVRLDDASVQALAPVLAKVSEPTAAALRNWELVPGLFEWESAAPRGGR